MNATRKQRDEYLNRSWMKSSDDKLPDVDKPAVFREIDFDTIVHNSSRYLDKPNYAALLVELARISLNKNELEKSKKLLSLIMRHYVKASSGHLLAQSHLMLGDIAFYQTDMIRARKKYAQSLGWYQRLGDNAGIAKAYNSLGIAWMESGKVTKGEAFLVAAKKISKENGMRNIYLKTSYNLANHYLIIGEYQKSIENNEEIIDVLDKQSDSKLLADVYHNMAIAYKFKNEFDHALTYLDLSLKCAEDTNNLYSKGLSYLEKAEILCRKGDYNTSTALATSSFQIFTDFNDQMSLADVYKIFGMINRETNRYKLAETYFKNSIRINQNHSAQMNLGEAHFEAALCYRNMGDSIRAAENMHSALKCFQIIKAKKKIETVSEILSEISAY